MRLFVSLAAVALSTASVVAQITGTIVTADGRAIAGATVSAYLPETTEGVASRLASEKPERIALTQVKTADDGTFSLDVKKAPQVQVFVTMPRMIPASFTASAREEIGAVALRTATMKRGRVTAAGKPLPSAIVRVEAGSGEMILRTDDQGRYELPDPSKWVKALTVIHPDYAMQQRRTSPGGALNLDVILDAGVEIKGKVVAENGETAVAGAKLWVDWMPLGESAQDGSFVIAHAPRQWREIRAAAGQRAAIRTRTAGALTLRLSKAASLSGRLVDAKTQKPLAGGVVTLHVGADRSDQGPRVNAIADAAGAYSFEALPPDRYRVSGEMSGYGLASAELTVSGAGPVVRTIYASALARVVGTVVDEDKAAVAGATVQTLPGAPGPGMRFLRAATITAPDGRFVLRRVETEAAVPLQARKKGHPSVTTEALKLAPGEVKRNVLITIPSGTEVSGRVTDVAGEPLSGVAVTAVPKAAGIAGMVVFATRGEGSEEDTRTASDGTFTLRLSEGLYNLRLAAEGYAAARRDDVRVAAGMEPVSVVMMRGVEIAGRLVNHDGSGISDASISSFRAETSASATTGADGSFVLSGLKEGSLMVQIRKEADLLFELRTLTAPSNDVVIKLDNSGAVAGRVVDASTKKPIPNFRAGFSGERRTASMRMTTPPLMLPFRNDDGSFALERVAPGSLQLIVDAPGYVRSTTTIEVPADRPLKDLEIALEEGARIIGKVTDPEGSPLSGVIVRVVSEQAGAMRGRAMDPSAGAVTDAAGEYALEGQKSGEQTFTFVRTGYVSERKAIKVTAGDNKLDVRLSRGMTLSGSVVTESGTPVAGAEISLTSAASSARFGQTVLTDPNGNFRVDGVSAGRYSISASKAGHVSAQLDDVDAATVGALKLVMKSGASIAGSVTGLTPRELTNVRVFAVGPQRTTGMPPSASVDGQGRFRLDGAAAGTTRVYAMTGSFGVGGSRRSESKTIEVPSTGVVEVTLAFDNDIIVRGHVTRDGEVLSNVGIVFQPAEGGISQLTTTTDASGNYEAVGVAAGRYNVLVSDPGSQASHVVEYEVRSSDRFDIDVRTGGLRGRVIDAETGAPIVEADVAIAPAGDRTGFFVRQDKRTSSDGAFTSARLSGGTYTVTAIKEGYGSATTDVEIRSGDTREIELKLGRSDGAVLRVVDARDRRPLRTMVVVNDASGRQIILDAFEPRADGTIRIPLGSGAYTLVLRSNGYALRTVAISIPGAQVQVPMTPGGNLHIENRGTEVTGRLIMAGGTPYPFSTIRDAFSIGRGTNPFPHIAPGQYTLQILNEAGTVTASQQVTIVEGQTTNVGI